MEHRVIHHFTTGSESTARMVEAIIADQKLREMLELFMRIEGRTRRNVLLRMAHYLAKGERREQG